MQGHGPETTAHACAVVRYLMLLHEMKAVSIRAHNPCAGSLLDQGNIILFCDCDCCFWCVQFVLLSSHFCTILFVCSIFSVR